MGNIASAWKQVGNFFIAYWWVIILICLIVFGYVSHKKLTNIWKKLIKQPVTEREQFTNSGKQLTKKLTDRWKELTNVGKVFCAGIGSIILGFLLLSGITASGITAGSKKSIIEGSAGFWNFIILIVSAPVAFVIWHFRDENNRQQIENQRKDINLKEFQKLSEWVSGAHLPEIKTVNKTTQKSSLKDGVEVVEKTTERSEEYSKRPDTADFDTFSKREGAVALQISAIYNLLPFFRGDYGESFRRPAFNLLKSAWQAMQQDSLKKLDGDHLSDEERKKIFDELTQKAKSPMGVALTQVLLSLNREYKKLNLRDFPEMLPNICLAGMNFHLSGVSELARDLSDLNLNGADFRKIVLEKAELQGCQLIQVKFDGAHLWEAKLDGANLWGAKLQDVDLKGAELKKADLRRAKLCNTYLLEANLQDAWLEGAELQNVNLTSVNLAKTYLAHADLQDVNLSRANLQHADLQFTKMRSAIFQKADLQNANLSCANAQYANFSYANLKACNFKWKQLKDNEELVFAEITINDFINNIYPDWKKTNEPGWEALTKRAQTQAMQKFCKETGMLIFDKSGTQIMPPPLEK